LLIVARTDAEAANLLDTNIDPRDHVFILGTTNPNLPALADLIRLATDKFERTQNPEVYNKQLATLEEHFPTLAHHVQEVWKFQDRIATAKTKVQPTKDFEIGEKEAIGALSSEWGKEAGLITYY